MIVIWNMIVIFSIELQPVQIGGIRVYTEHVRPNEMIMDVELL